MKPLKKLSGSFSCGRATTPPVRTWSIRRAVWQMHTKSSSLAITSIRRHFLGRTFEETDGYDEMVVSRDIEFVSHCEHHVVPIIGKAHVSYLPNRRVVGISKIARVVEAYTRRLQIQERRSSQIANAFERAIQPRGTAVVIEAEHQCMTTHGVKKPGCINGNQPNARRLPRRCETTIGI